MMQVFFAALQQNRLTLLKASIFSNTKRLGRLATQYPDAEMTPRFEIIDSPDG
jgi:hypothetical protein